MSEKPREEGQIVGVVGAGVMGQGVAQNLAQCGARVVLVDSEETALSRAREEIVRSLRLFRMVQPKSSFPSDSETVLGRIKFTRNLGDLASATYVIENTTEKWQTKEPVYRSLDQLCARETIFAANTSCFSITKLASLTKRPSGIIGIHFMNPVPLKPVVEVIRGYHTSDATIARTRELLTQMGKDAVIVNDSPGFVSNRVLMLTVNEAIVTVHEGIASADDVDRIFRDCFGHKMGPLATADLIGLDTILFSLEVLLDELGDPKFRPCPLLRKMVDAGLHGRKTGQGFFCYT